MKTVILSEGKDLNGNSTKIPLHAAKRSSKNSLLKTKN